MSRSILEKYIEHSAAGGVLPECEAGVFFDAVIGETEEAPLRGLLQTWHERGPSEDEIFLLAKVMRSRCLLVNSSHESFVDVVGTGGSRAKIFNISTAAAFVTAGAGVPVAKHGNRAATSNSGSADVLGELGIEPAVDAQTAERCLNDLGICYMFAPNFHRLSPVLAKVRRQLGFPTIFNNLGPLCNPAGAPHQMIGVWDASLVVPTARALARLGTTRSWVVHGTDGLDEITLSGPTKVAEVREGAVQEFEIAPEDFGLTERPVNHLKSGSAAASAHVIRQILAGNADGEARDIVLINSAAAIYLAGRASSLTNAVSLAEASVDSGEAVRKLQQLAAATNA